jgi:hypothetical protein
MTGSCLKHESKRLFERKIISKAISIEKDLLKKPRIKGLLLNNYLELYFGNGVRLGS